MFEGSYSRRRRRFFKTLLFAILAALILIIILYCYQNISTFTQSSQTYHSNYPDILKKQPSEKRRPRLNIDLRLKTTSASVTQTEEKEPKNFLSIFEFTHSPFLNLSSELPVIIPIIVFSKAIDIEVRDAIRRTWGFDQLYSNSTIQFKIFFLVGTDDSVKKRIQTEQILFDDVIQVSLPDFYSFLAYKELSAMLWMKKYLPNSPYYIKTEDDVIMNINVIINQFLPSMENYLKKNLVIGWFDREHNVDRGIYQRFINAVIPPSSIDLYYAMSSLYIVTSQAWNTLLDAIKSVENIQHPGDPFVTGILREAAHVEMKNLVTSTEYFKYEVGSGTCKDAFIRDPKLLLCTSPSLLSSTVTKTSTISRSLTEYFEVWNALLSKNVLRNEN